MDRLSMSENSPEKLSRPQHYCRYAKCNCEDKFLMKRYCQEYNHGSAVQNFVFISKRSNWDESKLQKEKDEDRLPEEATDQATFCCNTGKLVAKATISSFGQEFGTDQPINVQQCSSMNGPPPYLSFTLSGPEARNLKACLTITDEKGRIILELTLHPKDFPLESTKRAQENEEIEQEEHPIRSGEHEVPQQSEESHL